MVMALTSASIESAMHHLNIRFLPSNNHSNTFSHFKNLHKRWREGISSPRLVFPEYAADKELRVVKAIDSYLNRPKTWSDESKLQLLLSFIKPHKNVGSSIVFEWK